MPRAKGKPKLLKVGASENQVTAQVTDAAKILGLDLRRRNVGGMTDASGRYVPFNEKHDADWWFVIPCGPHRGRHVELEIKKEYFDPTKVRGQERERFMGQVAKLRRTNDQGGLGLWVDSGPAFLAAMGRILDGWSVEIDSAGYPWLVSPDEPRPGRETAEKQEVTD